ncbi:unnamed protein product [Cochlearia groenlandica]
MLPGQDIGATLDRKYFKVSPWVHRKVVALLTSKLAEACIDKDRGYVIKACIEVDFQKCYMVEGLAEDDIQKEICVICHEPLSILMACRKVQCGSHVYHKKCIRDWQRSKKSMAECPQCRGLLNRFFD